MGEPAEGLAEMDDFVRKMHTKSGLLTEIDHIAIAKAMIAAAWMVSGEGKNLAELIHKREHSGILPPTAIVKTLDPKIEAVIQRCLKPEPSERPATALAVAAALVSSLFDRPTPPAATRVRVSLP